MNQHKNFNNELNLNLTHQGLKLNQVQLEKSGYEWDSNPHPHRLVTCLQPNLKLKFLINLQDAGSGKCYRVISGGKNCKRDCIQRGI